MPTPRRRHSHAQKSFTEPSFSTKKKDENRFSSLDTNLFAGRADSHKWGQISAAVTNMAPASTSGESNKQYAKRMNQLKYYERDARTRNIKTGLWFLIAAILVGVLAFIASNVVYKHSINAHMAIEDEAFTNALAAKTSPTDQQYMLFTGVYQKDDEQAPAADALVLAYFDPGKKVISLVGVPAAMQMRDSNNDVVKLKDIYATEGDAGIVRAVQRSLNIELSHYIRVDENGFRAMIDEMGDASFEVLEDVVDKDAGATKLAPGLQDIDADKALFLMRANNYPLGDKVRQAHITAMVEKFIREYTSRSGLSFITTLDKLSHSIKTDLRMSDAKGFSNALRDMDAFTIYTAALPSTYVRIDKGYTVSLDKAHWAEMKERIEAGDKPLKNTEDIVSAVNPSSFTITVNNGSVLEGAATKAAEILTGRSYKVIDIGNAAMQVYDETLVIYKEEKDLAAAEAVVAQLGIGRTVEDSIYYSFETDILVVIGADWQAYEG